MQVGYEADLVPEKQSTKLEKDWRDYPKESVQRVTKLRSMKRIGMKKNFRNCN